MRRAALTVILSATCLALSGVAFPQQSTSTDAPLRWHELGPAPIGGGQYTGRISAVVCSPVDPLRYWVAGADGGVWRTADGGSSWTPLTDHMPTTAIGALALDPSDENVIYAGTGEANFANHSRFGLGIYRSVDGGDNWEHLAESTFAGRCISDLVIDPGSPNVLYASVTRAGGFPEMAAAKGHPQAGGDLGVFKSLDRGETWTRLANLPSLSITSLALDPNNPSTLYAGVGHIFGNSLNGVYRSLDGGVLWARLTTGLPSGSSIGRITVAVAPSDSTRVYALITNDCSPTGGSASTRDAYRSDNGGQSWQSLNIPSLQSSYGWYLSVVSVSPTDPNTVLMGGYSLRRSTNAGSSWSNVTPPHVDLHALAWDANGRLLAGDDGGLHRSTNLGSSWTSRNQGLGLIQFYAGVSSHPSNEEYFLGGFQDNGSNRRTGPGQTWSQVLGGDGGWTRINQVDPSVMFCEYQGTGNLYRSTNGGASYGYSGNGISGGDRNCFLPPYVYEPGSTSRMYYGTQRLYRSTNGGSSWGAISSDLTASSSGAIRAIAVSPADTGVIWVATNDGKLAVSTNGGFTFSTRRLGRPGWPRVTNELLPDPSDPGTLYLASAGFNTTQVEVTHDQGLTWQALDAGLPDLPVNCLALKPGSPDVLYAGTEAGVYATRNGGSTWQRHGQGMPHCPVIDLILEPGRNRMIAATQGRGLWRIALVHAPRDF